MSSADSLKFKIALSLLPGIGGVLARNLVSFIGSVEGIFRESEKNLLRIPGIGEVNARRIKTAEVLEQAESEIEFIDKYKIGVLFYTDREFPRRLAGCTDAPVLIFTKGNVNLDAARIVSIVGTRNATDYGKEICDKLISGFRERNYDIVVVSGLAYGIDVQAHKSSLKYNIPTAAVLGHGLDKIYPGVHSNIARKMVENGGLVTDFPSRTKIEPTNFLRRNRIIAGLSDATIVIESGETGGALVTADIASSYNRDVFAFPGRAGDQFSKGCNKLIKKNLGNLIEGIDDLEYLMGWEPGNQSSKPVQQALFVDLSPEEQVVADLLRLQGDLFIDQLAADAGLPMSKVSGILLNLEFKGVVVALPGKMYRLK